MADKTNTAILDLSDPATLNDNLNRLGSILRNEARKGPVKLEKVINQF